MIAEQAHSHAIDCMRVYREQGIHAVYEHIQSLKLSSSLELVAVLAAFQKENKMAYTPKNKTTVIASGPTVAPVRSVAAIVPVAPVAPATPIKEEKTWVNLREFGVGVIEVKACSYSPRLEKYILEVKVDGDTTVLTSVKETKTRTALLNEYAGENVSFLLELKAKSFKNDKGERIEYMELFPVHNLVGELEDTEHSF